jgi:hypothetical protein
VLVAQNKKEYKSAGSALFLAEDEDGIYRNIRRMIPRRHENISKYINFSLCRRAVDRVRTNSRATGEQKRV